MTLSSVPLTSLQRPDPAQMREKLFKQADADSSGAISKDEWKTATQNAPDGTSAPSADEMFAKIDSDGDGEITQTEMETADKAREAEMKTKFGQMGVDGIAGFNGSTDLIQSLLKTLQAEDSDSTAKASASDAASAKQKLIKELLAQLQEKNPQYSADGTNQSGAGVSLFTTTV